MWRGGIGDGYREMLYQDIAPRKLEVLLGLYRDALGRFTASPAKGEEMLGGPGSASQAAMVVVANAMLNLDEVITKN